MDLQELRNEINDIDSQIQAEAGYGKVKDK